MVPAKLAFSGSTFEARKCFVAPAGDGVGDDGLLDVAVAVHLGGVDVGHAGVDADAQRRDAGVAIVVLHFPRTLADDGDRDSRQTKQTVFMMTTQVRRRGCASRACDLFRSSG